MEQPVPTKLQFLPQILRFSPPFPTAETTDFAPQKRRENGLGVQARRSEGSWPSGSWVERAKTHADSRRVPWKQKKTSKIKQRSKEQQIVNKRKTPAKKDKGYQRTVYSGGALHPHIIGECSERTAGQQSHE